MEKETSCEGTEDTKHCWHTGSGLDMASYGSNGEHQSRTHYMCCWCAETKVVEHKFGPFVPKKHGPHSYHSSSSDRMIDPFDLSFIIKATKKM